MRFATGAAVSAVLFLTSRQGIDALQVDRVGVAGENGSEAAQNKGAGSDTHTSQTTIVCDDASKAENGASEVMQRASTAGDGVAATSSSFLAIYGDDCFGFSARCRSASAKDIQELLGVSTLEGISEDDEEKYMTTLDDKLKGIERELEQLQESNETKSSRVQGMLNLAQRVFVGTDSKSSRLELVLNLAEQVFLTEAQVEVARFRQSAGDIKYSIYSGGPPGAKLYLDAWDFFDKYDPTGKRRSAVFALLAVQAQAESTVRYVQAAARHEEDNATAEYATFLLKAFLVGLPIDLNKRGMDAPEIRAVAGQIRERAQVFWPRLDSSDPSKTFFSFAFDLQRNAYEIQQAVAKQDFVKAMELFDNRLHFLIFDGQLSSALSICKEIMRFAHIRLHRLDDEDVANRSAAKNEIYSNLIGAHTQSAELLIEYFQNFPDAIKHRTIAEELTRMQDDPKSKEVEHFDEKYASAIREYEARTTSSSQKNNEVVSELVSSWMQPEDDDGCFGFSARYRAASAEDIQEFLGVSTLEGISLEDKRTYIRMLGDNLKGIERELEQLQESNETKGSRVQGMLNLAERGFASNYSKCRHLEVLLTLAEKIFLTKAAVYVAHARGATEEIRSMYTDAGSFFDKYDPTGKRSAVFALLMVQAHAELCFRYTQAAARHEPGYDRKEYGSWELKLALAMLSRRLNVPGMDAPEIRMAADQIREKARVFWPRMDGPVPSKNPFSFAFDLLGNADEIQQAVAKQDFVKAIELYDNRVHFLIFDGQFSSGLYAYEELIRLINFRLNQLADQDDARSIQAKKKLFDALARAHGEVADFLRDWLRNPSEAMKHEAMAKEITRKANDPHCNNNAVRDYESSTPAQSAAVQHFNLTNYVSSHLAIMCLVMLMSIIMGYAMSSAA